MRGWKSPTRMVSDMDVIVGKWMGKKHLCFFQTETGNRAPNSGVKGNGANHYPRDVMFSCILNLCDVRMRMSKPVLCLGATSGVLEKEVGF